MIHLELPGSAIYVGYMPVLLQLTPLLAPPLPPCQAFNLLNLIIDRMGDHIRPFVGEMLRLMPALWQRAEGSSLVRIQVRVRGAEGSSLVRIQVRVRGQRGAAWSEYRSVAARGGISAGTDIPRARLPIRVLPPALYPSLVPSVDTVWVYP